MGATGKTISAAVSPLLSGLQNLSMRASAAEANVYDAARAYARALKERGPSAMYGPEAARLPADVAQGIARGVLTSPEDPSARPAGTGPVNPLADVIRQDYPDFSLWRALPKPVGRAVLGGVRTIAAVNPKAGEIAAGALDMAGKPEGVSIAVDLAAGEALNVGSAAIRGAIRQTPIPGLVSQAGDVVRQSKIGSAVLSKTSLLGQYRTGVREPLRQYLREMVGERGAKIAQLEELIDGDQRVIEAGARAFGMTPVERAKFLEKVYEVSPKDDLFTMQEYVNAKVRSNQITEDEGRYLIDGLRRLFEEAIPASRGAASLRRHTLYESSYRAAQRARDALFRVDRAWKDLYAMRVGTYQAPQEMVEGAFRFGPVLGPNIEGQRRYLVRQIVRANNELRNFGQTSRYRIPLLGVDEENLFRYTTDELLGLQAPQAQAQWPVQLMRPPRDMSLKATDRVYRAVFRRAPSGEVQGRIYNRYGEEVDRLTGPDVTSVAEDATRRYGARLTPTDEMARATPWEETNEGRRKVQGDLELVDQTGVVPSPEWAGADVRKTGPRQFQIGRVQKASLDLKDAMDHFVRYIPRYKSESLALEAGRRYGFEEELRPGISTRLGGRRVSKPVVSQEQVRETLRQRFAVTRGGEREVVEPLQDLVEASRTAIRRTADATSKSRFLHKVAQTFGDVMEKPGVPPEGWEVLGKARGFTTGMTKEARDLMGRTVVPNDVFRAVKDIDEVMQPARRRGLGKFAHDVLGIEKQYLTIINPQFSIRNQEWNVIVSFLRGNRRYENWVDAAKALGGKHDTEVVRGLDMTYAELRRLMLREGVIGGDLGFSTELGAARRARLEEPVTRSLPRAVEAAQAERGTLAAASEALRAGAGEVAKRVAPPFAALREFNQGGEALARASHFLYGVRDAGMGVSGSRLEVARTLFDYGRDFYTVSEAGLREVIPFYAWYRRIFPLTTRAVFEQPGTFLQLGSVMTKVNAMNGVSPEEFQYLGRAYTDALGIVLPDAPDQPTGTKRVLSIRGIGYADPGSIVRGPSERSSSYLGWWLGPYQAGAEAVRPDVTLLFSTAFEAGVGGRVYGGDIVKLPQAVSVLPEAARNRMDITMKDGAPYGPAYWVPLLQFLSGSAGNALASAGSKNPRIQARWRAWATSVSVDPSVPFEDNKLRAIADPYYEILDQKRQMRQRLKTFSRAEQESLMREEALRKLMRPEAP